MTSFSVSEKETSHVAARPLANCLVMVRPSDFGFNEETGKDNEFQSRPHSDEDVREQALLEFDGMVNNLRQAGARVLILEKAANTVRTPDAVFPNNWFSTDRNGNLFIYPMMAENRRQERRVSELEILLRDNGYQVSNLIYVGGEAETQSILEGTGAMVMDHHDQWLYAARSERCHPQQLANFLTLSGYQGATLFDTASSAGNPIYHTNVMMSVGRDFAVLCSDSFVNDAQLEEVRGRLAQSKEVIDISLEQMELAFCGNILQLQSMAGTPLISMSRRAFNGFTESQRRTLAQFGELVVNDIEVIERIGGGSARCMMAEIFLPDRSD